MAAVARGRGKKRGLARPAPGRTPPGPGDPGRKWGGAGRRHLAFLVPIRRNHSRTYAWRWSQCLGRCYQALPLSCSFLRPCRALPAPFPRLSEWVSGTRGAAHSSKDCYVLCELQCPPAGLRNLGIWMSTSSDPNATSNANGTGDERQWRDGADLHSNWGNVVNVRA